MKNFKYKFCTLILLVITNFLPPVQAGSFYSSKGIGLVRYFVSGRSVGMGGVGLAIADKMTVSYLNPAGLVVIPITFISGNLLHEATDLKGASQNAFISNTNVSGVQFVIPIKRNRAVISLGLNPYSSIEYSFDSTISQGEKTFIESISADGGVNTGFFSFSFRPIKNFYLGITGLFYFGVLKNSWEVNFISQEFSNSQDQISQSFTTGNIRIGFIYQITPRWSLGGVFTPSATFNVNKKLTQRFGEFSDFPDSDIEIPLAFGVGTAFYLSKKVLAEVDFYLQKWSNFEGDGFVNDSKRIGFGVEYSARGSERASYFSRMAFRAGIFYRDLGLEDPAGEKVTELFGTLGLGLPIKWSAGRIDLALEGGRRGSLPSNPFRETIVRITGSITVGERWFYRGGRL
ncbi:MAG: hypothetical protein ACE5JB_06155 [bacterium]